MSAKTQTRENSRGIEYLRVENFIMLTIVEGKNMHTHYTLNAKFHPLCIALFDVVLKWTGVIVSVHSAVSICNSIGVERMRV